MRYIEIELPEYSDQIGVGHFVRPPSGILQMPVVSVYPSKIIPTKYQKIAEEKGFQPLHYVVAAKTKLSLQHRVAQLILQKDEPIKSEYFEDKTAKDWPHITFLWG